MLTQPVSLVAAPVDDAEAAGSETSSAKRHAAFELCARAFPAPSEPAKSAAAKNETANAFFILSPSFYFLATIKTEYIHRLAAVQSSPLTSFSADWRRKQDESRPLNEQAQCQTKNFSAARRGDLDNNVG
jgi:hypothetical protein